MSEPVRVDIRRCLHETLDGDTIVIDSERGWLLVFDGVASAVWQLLVGGAIPGAIRAEADRRYGSIAGVEVGAFVDELAAAGLLVPGADANAIDPSDAAWPDTYTSPTVNRFEDVADILMMDPIHEVEVDEGWPNAPRPPGPERGE